MSCSWPAMEGRSGGWMGDDGPTRREGRGWLWLFRGVRERGVEMGERRVVAPRDVVAPEARATCTACAALDVEVIKVDRTQQCGPPGRRTKLAVDPRKQVHAIACRVRSLFPLELP